MNRHSYARASSREDAGAKRFTARAANKAIAPVHVIHNAGGALKHGGRRFMAFAVGNAKAEMRGNTITIMKQAAGSAKIDPLMALFDAVVAMG